MKLYEHWFVIHESEEAIAFKITKLMLDKSKYYKRAKKLRNSIAGKSHVNPNVAHELNVVTAKLNKIDKMLFA